MHFLINPFFLKPILRKLKSLRCAKLSISYGKISSAGLCLFVTLQISNPVNHLTQNETYFPSLAQNECVQKYCSADFQFVVR